MAVFILVDLRTLHHVNRVDLKFNGLASGQVCYYVKFYVDFPLHSTLAIDIRMFD